MWTIIQNENDYKSVINRIEELSQNPPPVDSKAGRELLLLGHLASHYEDTQFPVIYPDPIEAIKVRMEDLGLTVNDLLEAFGDKGTASKVLSKQRSLSLNMVRVLSDQLSLPADLLIQPIRKSIRKKVNLVKEPRSKYGKRKSKR